MPRTRKLIYFGEIAELIKNGLDIFYRNCTIKAGNSSNVIILSNMDIYGKIKLVDCYFEDQVKFLNSEFLNEVNFINTAFMKSVSFEGSRFYEKLRFARSLFQNGANFDNAKFKKIADFSDSDYKSEESIEESKHIENTNNIFEEEVSFCNTRFGGIADFSGCSFSDARFNDTIFDDYIIFNRVTSKKVISFTHTRFTKEPVSENIQFSNHEIKANTFHSFSHACMNSSLYSKSGEFFIISGYAFEEAYHAEVYGSRNKEKAKNYYENTILSYRLAEHSYDLIKESRKSGEAYKKAAEFKLRNPGYSSLPERIWLCIRKVTSDYGESPVRFLTLMVSILSFFTIIYIPSNRQNHIYQQVLLKLIPASIILIMTALAFGKLKKAYIIALTTIVLSSGLSFLVKINGISSHCYGSIIKAFYFSLVTFTTLGLSSFTPENNLALIITGIEVFSGYLLFGVLLTIMARKIIR